MGLLGDVFNFLDPIMDRVDPGYILSGGDMKNSWHNNVQGATTGSKYTSGQRPYFEALAGPITDIFLPGVGSLMTAADGASTGNWGKAALGALGTYGNWGNLTNMANGATAAQTASEGTQALNALDTAGGADVVTPVSTPTDLPATQLSTEGLYQTPQEYNWSDMGYTQDAARTAEWGSPAQVPASETQFTSGLSQTPQSNMDAVTLSAKAQIPYEDAVRILKEGGLQSTLSPAPVADAAGSALKSSTTAKMMKGLSMGNQMMQGQQKKQQPQPQPQFAPFQDYTQPRQNVSFMNYSPYSQFGGYNPRPYSQRGLL